MIDALLTLARSEAGLAVREPLDLASITREVLAARAAEAERRGPQIDASLAFAPCLGDARLLGRLIANLVDNAIRYDIPAGRVRGQDRPRSGRSTRLVRSDAHRPPHRTAYHLRRRGPPV